MTDYICTNCGYQGRRRAIKAGSRGMEIFLWVVFLIPGPFYSLWRILAAKKGCVQCSETTMVSAHSLLGKVKMQEINKDISPEELAKIPDRWQKDREEYNKKHGIVIEVKKELDVVEIVPPVENKQDEKW